MPDENTQDSEMVIDSVDLTPDEHAAALGFITTLGEHAHMAQQPQEEPTSEETPQEQKTEPSEEKEPEDHEAEQDTEIQAIRAELEQLLAEENKNGTESKDTGVAE